MIPEILKFQLYVTGDATNSLQARAKEDKSIGRLYRNHEIEPVAGKCLLEQGMICLGVATRGGCGAPCPDANMPCSGCYGPPEGVADQGGAMIASLGSIIDPGEHRGKGEKELALRLEEFLDASPPGRPPAT